MLRTTALACGFCLWSATGVMADQTQPVDVPGQPLGDAITELGRETGLRIAADASVVDGKTSTAVQGPMTPTAALNRLLEGTGLETRPVGDIGVVVANNVVSQNATGEPLDLGTLVLSGELIDRSVQDSQTSAVVLDAQTIEDRAVVNLSDVIAITPGVTPNVGSTFTIRGVTTDGATGNGAGISRTISVSVDGARVSDLDRINVSSISTWDVRQVEVLRGPQSTQTGRNALAGAVILESNDPEYFDEYRLRFGAGNNGQASLAFVLNTPMIEDRLAFRLSAETSFFDGETLNTTTNDDGFLGGDNTTVKAALRFDLTPTFGGVLRFTHINDANSNGAENVLTANLPGRIRTDNFANAGFQTDINSTNLTLNWELQPGLTLSSRTIYTDASTVFRFDADLGALPIASAVENIKYESFEQEFRLNFESDRLRAVAGLFFTNIKNDLVQNAVFGVTPITVQNSSDITNYALFGELEYDLSDRWSVIAGARYDFEDLKFTSGATSIDTDYSAFLPKAGVVYSFSDDTSLGLTYQRGYRAGGAETVTPLPPSVLAPFVNQFDPETTDTVELALRHASADGNFVLNANAYHTTWDDQQVFAQTAPGVTTTNNAGSSELWGAEIDMRVRASENVEVYAGLAYARTEFKEFFFNGVQLAGNELIRAPEWSGTLGASYDFGNGLRVGGDVNYTGATFSDPTNTQALRNGDYWLFNANVSYDLSDTVQLSGFIKNIFDEQYTVRQSAGGGFVPANSDVGTGREFGFFLNATF